MNLILSPYLLIMIMAAIICIFLAVFVWFRRQSNSETVPLILLLLGIIEWIIAALLGLIDQNLAHKILWAKFEYIGVVSVPLGVLGYVLYHSGYNQQLTVKRAIWLALIPLATLILAWTNEIHGLIWTEYIPYRENGLVLSEKTYGFGFWIYWAYSYLVLLAATIFSIRLSLVSTKLFRWQSILIIIGILMPWIGNLLYVIHINPFGNLDLTPLAFSITGIMLAIGMFRWQLFDIKPIAQAAVIAGMADGLLILDNQGRILDANPAAQIILKTDLQELVGKQMEQIIPDWLPVNKRPDRTNGKSLDLKLKGGVENWSYEISDTPFYEKPGVPGGMIVFLQDTTNRKRLEEKLREIERKHAEALLEQAENKFAILYQNMSVGVIYRNADGQVIDMNPAAERMLGVGLAQINELSSVDTYFKTIREDGSDLPLEEYPGMISLKTGKPLRNQMIGMYFPKDDTHHWIIVNTVPLFKPGEDMPYQVFVTFDDITGRKQAEEALRNRNRMLLANHKVMVEIGSDLHLSSLLSSILEQAQSMLNADRGGGVYLDEPGEDVLKLAYGSGINQGREGVIIQMGEGVAGRVYQTSHALVIDDYTHWEGHTTILVDTPPSTVMGVPLFLKNEVIGVLTLIADSSVRKFTVQDVQQAEMFAAQTAVAIQNARLYQQAKQEIAGRKQYEKELKTLNAELEERVAMRTEELLQTNIELEHANRAKDEFLATMSHELRTPLNSILGLSEMLLEQRGGLLNAKQQKSLQTIEASGHHLLELINDVLDLSKIEAGKFDFYPQLVDVDTLCKSSLAFVKEQAMQKSIAVSLENEGTRLKIYADPRRLKQILVNLLTNAIKFTLEQGHVNLKVHANVEDDLIQFSVTDNGIGIAPEDLQQLFKPFVQVDSSLTRQFEGTGLGLALVQKLTDLHGGSVQVESEVGVGSCFTINIPWGKDIVTQLEIIESRNELRVGAGIGEIKQTAREMPDQGKVLLAEDNMANILTIGDYLESHSYQVITAHNGLEAIEKAEETNPSIILMDIQMPTMDGLEAIRRLRTNPLFKTTPIIALTAMAMPGDRERCLEAGANEYMSKPVSLKELVRTINELSRE